MNSSSLYPCSDLQGIALEIVELLKPYCERIEIAGSIRREKPMVKDIELVMIPKFEAGQADLFGEAVEQVNLLDQFLSQKLDDGTFGHRPDKNGVPSWGAKSKRGVYRSTFPVDLFSVISPAQWGVIFAIRTGSAEFARNFMTQREFGGNMPPGMRVQNGALWQGDRLIETPEESDFFAAIGYHDFPAPENRYFDSGGFKVITCCMEALGKPKGDCRTCGAG